MSIELKNLHPNPFVDMDMYPVDRPKVDRLKEEIRKYYFLKGGSSSLGYDLLDDMTYSTTALLARKRGDRFELAFGHDELVAFRELGLRGVDINIYPLDDKLMIRLLANEECGWISRPSDVIETVRMVKILLDGDIAKCQSLATSDKSITHFFQTNIDLEEAKAKGVGSSVLWTFLGQNWPLSVVEAGLSAVDACQVGWLDMVAICNLPTMKHVDEFRTGVYLNDVPKTEHEMIVAKIADEKICIADIAVTVGDFWLTEEEGGYYDAEKPPSKSKSLPVRSGRPQEKPTASKNRRTRRKGTPAGGKS